MAAGPRVTFDVRQAGELAEALFEIGEPEDDQGEDDDFDSGPRDRVYQRLMPLWRQ